MSKEKEKKLSWFLGISGSILLICSLLFIAVYFKNVSIGSWIAKENYSNNGEWFKQMGLFIATMMGFYIFLSFCCDLIDHLPKLNKKNEKTKET